MRRIIVKTWMPHHVVVEPLDLWWCSHKPTAADRDMGKARRRGMVRIMSLFATTPIAGAKNGRDSPTSLLAETAFNCRSTSVCCPAMTAIVMWRYLKYCASVTFWAFNGCFVETTQTNLSEKIVSQLTLGWTPRPATVITVSVRPLARSSKQFSCQAWTSSDDVVSRL